MHFEREFVLCLMLSNGLSYTQNLNRGRGFYFGPVPSDDFMPVFLILLDHRTSGKVALSGEPKSRGATTLSRVVPLLYGIP